MQTKYDNLGWFSRLFSSKEDVGAKPQLKDDQFKQVAESGLQTLKNMGKRFNNIINKALMIADRNSATK